MVRSDPWQTLRCGSPTQYSLFYFSASREYVWHISAVNKHKGNGITALSFHAKLWQMFWLEIACVTCSAHVPWLQPVEIGGGGMQGGREEGGERERVRERERQKTSKVLCLSQTHVHWWVQRAKRDTTVYNNHQGVHVITIAPQTCYPFQSHCPKGTRNTSFLIHWHK